MNAEEIQSKIFMQTSLNKNQAKEAAKVAIKEFQDKSKEETEDRYTFILDAINKALTKWGIKDKLSFQEGYKLLSHLHDELLATFGKEGEG